ncbi:hypothetical protein Fmac_020863 [Flemingia macrophylla]|uniref:Pentatricopeptide repeat protein n=1 Tax=Flemingia macrophylla TaxID=520843 RepID=A0ABD1LV93_9FABA
MGIVPDVYMISIVVNRHFRQGSVDAAKRFVENMEGMGFEANHRITRSISGSYTTADLPFCSAARDGNPTVVTKWVRYVVCDVNYGSCA